MIFVNPTDFNSLSALSIACNSGVAVGAGVEIVSAALVGVSFVLVGCLLFFLLFTLTKINIAATTAKTLTPPIACPFVKACVSCCSFSLS